MRERTYEIKIEGVPIIVTKKRMKNMYLRISKEDGTVRISAPHQMSDARIAAFAGERIEWIRKYQRNNKEAGERLFGKPGTGCGEIARRKKQLKREVERLVAKGAGGGGESLRNTIRQMKTRMGVLQCADTSHQHQSGALVQAAGVPRVCRGT